MPCGTVSQHTESTEGWHRQDFSAMQCNTCLRIWTQTDYCKYRQPNAYWVSGLLLMPLRFEKKGHVLQRTYAKKHSVNAVSGVYNKISFVT